MFTFECVLPPSDVDDKEKFDPCWIRSALVARAKATLQALTIIGPPRPDTFMGSFQPIEVLREVCVEWVFLFPDDCNLETWPSSVLPPSIHILKLLDHSDRTGRKYESLIHGLQHAKNKTCLQLEKVDIALDWWEVTGELDELKDLCKQVGISLTFGNRD